MTPFLERPRQLTSGTPRLGVLNGKEHREVFTDDLVRRVPRETRRTRVPGDDAAAGVEHEDRVVTHGLHHQSQLFRRARELAFLALLWADVLGVDEYPAGLSVIVVPGPHLPADPINLAVSSGKFLGVIVDGLARGFMNGRCSRHGSDSPFGVSRERTPDSCGDGDPPGRRASSP